ncbi:MAG: peptidoglycan DD-metalloendopeptidase family protein [Candidatus Aegiribacteria sp.]|nr:peptidoglycan DD-metalloendopeptidase family protein [Candidatus Aegiribacteria sp.]
MTNKREFPSSALTVLILFLTVSFVISCAGEPEDGEIVIRAEDIVPGDSILTADTLSPADTVVFSEPDTLSKPDSAVTLIPDFPALDSTVAVEPDECPWERIALEINGSIYASLRNRVDAPDILGAHIVRCMWWDTDPWNGMNAGDSLYVLSGETGRENQVIALKYVPREGTSNMSFSVYSFRMTGDNYPSHYYSDGIELMKLLNYMPITTFEEMTGPCGEPRGNHSHSGVDYKAPEGTPVRTCRGGSVTRLNWNQDYNGNCVEIEIGSGYSEIFLHLQGVAERIHEGSILEKGDIVGYVGSTGVTSTAPHIHYQINDENGNPIDPYLFYSSYRRRLSPEDMAEFSAFRDRCDLWLKMIPE